MKSNNDLINRPIGLEVDLTDTIAKYTRLGFKVGESSNILRFHEKILPWCAITRCILDDNGNVISRYNDENYDELSELGQVMVEIPLHYYKLEILEKDLSNLRGNILTKFRIWVSYIPRKGFSVPNIFIDDDSNVRDYVYISAYESSLNTVTNKLESLPDKSPYKIGRAHV